MNELEARMAALESVVLEDLGTLVARVHILEDLVSALRLSMDAVTVAIQRVDAALAAMGEA